MTIPGAHAPTQRLLNSFSTPKTGLPTTEKPSFPSTNPSPYTSPATILLKSLSQHAPQAIPKTQQLPSPTQPNKAKLFDELYTGLTLQLLEPLNKASLTPEHGELLALDFQVLNYTTVNPNNTFLYKKNQPRVYPGQSSVQSESTDQALISAKAMAWDICTALDQLITNKTLTSEISTYVNKAMTWLASIQVSVNMQPYTTAHSNKQWGAFFTKMHAKLLHEFCQAKIGLNYRPLPTSPPH